MSNAKRVGEIQERAGLVGLTVCTWSPGDGITRYRFFKTDAALPGHIDYFSSRELYTALGKKEALTFICGYAVALREVGQR